MRIPIGRELIFYSLRTGLEKGILQHHARNEWTIIKIHDTGPVYSSTLHGAAAKSFLAKLWREGKEEALEQKIAFSRVANTEF